MMVVAFDYIADENIQNILHAQRQSLGMFESITVNELLFAFKFN